jgi:hypothetical protein
MNKIITEIYEKHIPLKIFKKLKKYYDWELMYDFEQEMILQLFYMNPDKIKDLYQKNELDKYFGQICLNQLTNPRSTYNRLYETTLNKLPIENYENILQ